MEYFTFNIADVVASVNPLVVLCGLVVAALINLTGVGGGVMIIPILSIFFNMPPVTVVGTASLYITFTKFFSSTMHIYNKKVHWKTSSLFLLGAVPSSLLISWLVVTLLKKSSAFFIQVQNFVHYATVVFMLIACVSMLLNKEGTGQKEKKPVWLLFPSGALAGAIMALTGIGGGVLILPLLNFATNLKIKSIVSCSIVVAFVISTISGLVYSSRGHFNLTLLFSLLLGAVLGLYFSRFLENILSQQQLKVFVVCTIAIAAVAMLGLF